MKNLLFALFSLLLITSSQAQDFTYLLSMSKAEAIAFSNNISKSVREPWKFIEAVHSGSYLRVSYVPSNTSESNLKKIKNNGLNVSGVKYYTVQFKKFKVGEDKELEIEGVTKFKFKSVDLIFLDGFKVWEKMFFNGTTIERIRAAEDCLVPLKKDDHKKLKFSSVSSTYWRIELLN